MKTIHHGEISDGRRFTVVGVYEKLEGNKNAVNFGVAICGPQDNFTRKVGRSIAEGRALRNPTLVKELKIELPEDKTGFMELSKLGYQVLETVQEDPYIYQEILSQQSKEIEEERKIIRLAQIKEHEEKLRQQEK